MDADMMLYGHIEADLLQDASLVVLRNEKRDHRLVDSTFAENEAGEAQFDGVRRILSGVHAEDARLGTANNIGQSGNGAPAAKFWTPVALRKTRELARSMFTISEKPCRGGEESVHIRHYRHFFPVDYWVTLSRSVAKYERSKRLCQSVNVCPSDFALLLNKSPSLRRLVKKRRLVEVLSGRKFRNEHRKLDRLSAPCKTSKSGDNFPLRWTRLTFTNQTTETHYDHSSFLFDLPEWTQNFPHAKNASAIDLGFIATVPQHPVILDVLQDMYLVRRSVLEDPKHNYWVFCSKMKRAVERFQQNLYFRQLNLNLGAVRSEVDERTALLRNWLADAYGRADFDLRGSETDTRQTDKKRYVVQGTSIYIFNLRFRPQDDIGRVFETSGVPDLVVWRSAEESDLVRQESQISTVDRARSRSTMRDAYSKRFAYLAKQEAWRAKKHQRSRPDSPLTSWQAHFENLFNVDRGKVGRALTKLRILELREVTTPVCGAKSVLPISAPLARNDCNTYFVDEPPGGDVLKGRVLLKHFHRTKIIPPHEMTVPVTNVFTYPWSNTSLAYRTDAFQVG